MNAADDHSAADRSADERDVLEQARARCLALLGQLRRDAAELDRPSRLVTDAARAEGRAAYGRAAAAAEGLLRRIEQSMKESTEEAR